MMNYFRSAVWSSYLA